MRSYILEELERIKNLNSKCDLNTILRIASNNAGYLFYTDAITDNDLLKGLIQIETIEPGYYSPHGNYEGKLL